MTASTSRDSSPVNATSMQLEGDCAIVISRTFNAPAQILFDAWTRPEFVRRWWAPKSHGVTIASCEADVRVGGKYRYVLHQDTGQEIAFSGRYTEISPPTRLVYTQSFEQMPEGEAVIRVTFEERQGKTLLVAHETYPSKAVRDTVLASGMEHGMRETLEQLEALVATLRSL